MRKKEAAPERLPEGLSDSELWKQATSDVKPLTWDDLPVRLHPPVEMQPARDEDEALFAEFCRNGSVEIEQTAEYVEHSEPGARVLLRDLGGRLSVQDHLDLHQKTLNEARSALERFLLGSVRMGYRCVKVIHGRGLHSPDKRPVLRDNVHRWLRTRRLARHVIAFRTAPPYDGGAGAVYVLLRRTR